MSEPPPAPRRLHATCHTHTHTLPTWHCHMQLFHTQLVTHTLATQHCHTHTQLFHIAHCHTHNSFTHNLSYTHTLPTFANTTLSHTRTQLFHIQHCHTHTHAQLFHTTLSCTTLPHTILLHTTCHTQPCHTQLFHTQHCRTQSLLCGRRGPWWHWCSCCWDTAVLLCDRLGIW